MMGGDHRSRVVLTEREREVQQRGGEAGGRPRERQIPVERMSVAEEEQWSRGGRCCS
jgi:hypothetical protein